MADVWVELAPGADDALGRLFTSGNDALDTAKKQLVHDCGLAWRHRLTAAEPLPLDFVRCVRLLAVNQIELYFARGDAAAATEPLSPRNELETNVTLRRAFRQRHAAAAAANDPAAAVYAAAINELDRRTADLVAPVTTMPPDDAAARDEVPAVTALRESLEKAGARGVASVRVVDGLRRTGRGMVAPAPLAVAESGPGVTPGAATALLEIPFSELVTLEAALASPTAGAALREIEGLDEATTLMLFIIHEAKVRGLESRWAAYWATVPTTFTTGLYMPERDVAVLDDGGAEVAKSIRDQQEQLARAHAVLFPALSDYYPAVFPAAAFTLDNLRWARAVLDSRELLVRRRGQLVSCLAPLVDMLNHAPTAHCWHRWFDDEADRLCVELNAPVSAGQQIYLSYGPLRTWQLLQYYGFVPDDNPYDLIDVVLGDVAALTDAQRRVLAQWDLSPEHLIRAGPPAPACLAYLRVVAASAAELRKLGARSPLTTVLSAANERQAHTLWRDTLQALRDRWRPEVTDNELVRAAAGSGGPLTFRMLAVRYRRSQLHLLERALAAAEAALAALT